MPGMFHRCMLLAPRSRRSRRSPRRRRRSGLPGMPGGGGRSRRSAVCGRAGADGMRTLIIGLAGQQQARSAREAARTSRPCHRQAVACGEETSISPSQRPPAAIAHTRGLAPGPAGTFGPGHLVRLPGPAGRLAGWSRSPSGTAACPRRAGGSDAWTDGRPCGSRGRARRSPRGCCHAVPIQYVYSFSAPISCSGPRAARRPALGPAPGSGADRTCWSAGATSGRAPA